MLENDSLSLSDGEHGDHTVGNLGTDELPKFVLVIEDDNNLTPCLPIRFVEGGMEVWDHEAKPRLLAPDTKLRLVSYLEAKYV